MTLEFAGKSWHQRVSLDEAVVLDAICDQFESQWLKSGYPSIEEYASQSVQTHRPQLLAELVSVDMYYRQRNGEATSLDDYFARFPELRSHLRSTDGDHATVVAPQSRDMLPPTEPGPADIQLLGDHQLQEILGEGSFGSVWRAWNPKLERIDAVKLPRDRAQTRRQMETFLHEARAAARLDHRNIVRVHGFGEEAGGYIVFEFVAGTTLSQLHRSRKMEVRESADICRQLADALDHAHENNIIHRDIKSSNVMMDGQGVPRLTDFGLARRVDVASTIAHGGAIMGTIPYMSPEQLEGKGQIDARSDIYSLGVILYELLTGSVPFSGERSTVVSEILTKAPDPPRMKDKSIPRDLETICLKAIAKRKSDRYATAAEFRDDLQRFLNGEPVTARRLSLVIRFARYIRRNPALAAGYAGAFVCAGVAAAALMNQSNGRLPNVIEQELIDQAKQSIGTAKEADPSGQWSVSITSTPPGATLHFVPRDPATGEPQPHRSFDAKGTTPLNIDLRPGPYIVTAELPGTRRFQEVERLVPNSKESFPIGGRHRSWIRSRERSPENAEIDWPAIEIPEESIVDEMVLIKGSTKFRMGDIDDPDSLAETVDVSDFYVSRTEFTAGDYLRMYPQVRNQRDFIDRELQPDDAYPEMFYQALDLAEFSGCRLMTVIEFEYLARQINVPDAPLDAPMTGSLQHRDWDVVPSAPEVKGLLTGFPEWVNAPIYYSLEQHATSLPQQFNLQAVMCGLPMNVTERELELSAVDPFTRHVFPADTRTGVPPTAFRLVRSAHPAGSRPEKTISSNRQANDGSKRAGLTSVASGPSR